MERFDSIRTVDWHNGKVRLIDQTLLPSKFQYLECETVAEVADAIRRLAVRGAPAIGATAAYGMALAAQGSSQKDREAFLAHLKQAGQLLISTRPTAVNLKWAVDRVYRKITDHRASLDELKQLALREADKIADEDVESNRRMGALGATLLKDGDRVLTHCKWS